jgi:hypothetical protein
VRDCDRKNGEYTIDEIRELIMCDPVNIHVSPAGESPFLDSPELSVSNILDEKWLPDRHRNLHWTVLRSLAVAGGIEERLVERQSFIPYVLLTYFVEFIGERRFAARLPNAVQAVPVKMSDFEFSPTFSRIEHPTVRTFTAGTAVEDLRHRDDDIISSSASGAVWVASGIAGAAGGTVVAKGLVGDPVRVSFASPAASKSRLGDFSEFVMRRVFSEMGVELSPGIGKDVFDFADPDSRAALCATCSLIFEFHQMSQSDKKKTDATALDIFNGDLSKFPKAGTSRSMITLLERLGFSTLGFSGQNSTDGSMQLRVQSRKKKGSKVPEAFKGVQFMASPRVSFDEPLVSISTLVQMFDWQRNDQITDFRLAERIRSATNFDGRSESTGSRYVTMKLTHILDQVGGGSAPRPPRLAAGSAPRVERFAQRFFYL